MREREREREKLLYFPNSKTNKIKYPKKSFKLLKELQQLWFPGV